MDQILRNSNHNAWRMYQMRRLQNQSIADIRKMLLGFFETHFLSQSLYATTDLEFRSTFKKFAREFDIKVITSSSHMPQSNGKAENEDSKR